jgi:hypothetical protein
MVSCHAQLLTGQTSGKPNPSSAATTQWSKEATMKNQTAKSLAVILAFVLGMACTQSAPAQTFKRVNVQGGAALTQIAAGGASVWARSSSGHPYILKGKQFVLAF